MEDLLELGGIKSDYKERRGICKCLRNGSHDWN